MLVDDPSDLSTTWQYIIYKPGNLKMDLEQTVAALLTKNEQLVQENEKLNLLLCLFKENFEMRTSIQRSNNDTLEAPTGIVDVLLFQ